MACYATLRKALRRARWRWRRTRRRTGKPPTPHRVRAARKALSKLRAREQAGHCDLLYGDESGFCLQPTLGRCWQPPGPTLAVPAQAHSRRWNVCGFLRGDGELAHLGRVGRLGAKEFIEAVETRLLPALRRPSILVLDNGPCHRARLVRAKRAEWRRRGLRLLFLPPYCPHLNRIETLWRLVKHHWLPLTAYANFATLRESVTTLLNTIGLDHRVSFS